MCSQIVFDKIYRQILLTNVLSFYEKVVRGMAMDLAHLKFVQAFVTIPLRYFNAQIKMY